jgi:hypothetical protein
LLSRIDGKINGVTWEHKVCQWRKRGELWSVFIRRERRALVYFHWSEPLEKKREPLWRTGRGISTPYLPMIT